MIERIVVVGAGAVGGSIGAMLYLSGGSVLLVARGAHGDAIRKPGLRFRTPDTDVIVHPSSVASTAEVDWRKGDVAIVAVKSQDAESALDQIVITCGKSVPVVCATNGMECERWAADRFDTVLSMLVWIPGTYLGPGEVSIHAAGSLGVLDTGPVCGDQAEALSEEFCEMLRNAGFDALSRTDIEHWKYAKWITNLGNTARALVSDDWKRVAEYAQQEGEKVLTAAGIDRVSTEKLLERTSAVRLAPIAGEDRPGGSTWQSRKRGRPLESPWIEGAMADLAETYGLSAPVNRFLSEASKGTQEFAADEVFAAAGIG